MIDCRCGYQAENTEDLTRHVASWDRANADQPDKYLDHTED